MSKIRWIGIAIAVIVLLSFAFSCASATDGMQSATYYKPLYGDTNLDGAVNTADAVRVLHFCCGTLNLNAIQRINADVSGDSIVNTADAVVIMQYIVGSIKSMPVEEDNLTESDVVFANESFPQDGERVNYGRSHNLKGVIVSPYPILSVTVKVIDNESSRVEAQATSNFSASNELYRYDTFRSESAIDDLVRFAALSTGEKTIKLYITNTHDEGILLFVGTFRVGFTYAEIAESMYVSGQKPTSAHVRGVLNQLNSFDLTTKRGQVASEGVKWLGTEYEELDCSGFARRTYSRALGIALPRTAADQSEYCAEQGLCIEASELNTGDLVFMSRRDCDCGRYHEVHHVALFLCAADGERYLIESTGSKNGVCIRQFWGDTENSNWYIDSYATFIG